MAAESINKVRIKLLAECFGISGLGVLLNLLFLINVFLFAPSMMFPLCVWTLAVLATTGIVQIVFNELMLTPIFSWLNSRFPDQDRNQEKGLSSVIKLALFFISFWLVVLILGIIIVRNFTSLGWAQIGIVCGVGFGSGMAFLASWLLAQRWVAKKSAMVGEKPIPAFETADTFLRFPLKSAGLSLGLWVYAGIALSLGYHYLAGFSRFESIYILLIALSSGAMAFPFQYLLFKRTLNPLLRIFLNDHPRLPEQKGLFRFSLRYKLFICFASLTVFSVSFSFILNYSRTVQILKNKSAILYDAELGREISELSRGSLDPGYLSQVLAGKKGGAGSYFLVSRAGQALSGNPGEQLSPDQLQEMLGKEKGAFLMLKSDAVVVYNSLPGSGLILGKIHNWQELQADIRNIQYLTLSFIGIILLLCGVFAVLASGEIFSPLQAIVSEAGMVAERNFAERPFPLCDDEMSDLSRSFLQMRLSIKNYVQHSDQLIGKMESTVSQLDSTTHLLSQIAGEQSEGSAHQASSLEEVHRILERLSESAQRLSEKSREIEHSARQTFQAYNDGVKILSSAINAVRDGQQQVSKIQEVMSVLESQSRKIKEIVGIIEEIATQNNLLAFNALVEASVAGEAGERFSVVANEMKRLAIMTQEFNTNIGAMIKDVLNAVSGITKATQEGGELMDQSARLVTEAGEAFTGFSSLIDLSVTSSKEIVNSMSFQIRTNEEMTRALSEIKVVAHQLAGRTTEIQGSVERLVNLGEELKGLTSKPA